MDVFSSDVLAGPFEENNESSQRNLETQDNVKVCVVYMGKLTVERRY
jgi:hypothetical protein